MNRAFLHIGVAKTATTTLQRAVFAKHSQIAYLGRPYRDRHAPSTRESESCLPLHVIHAIREQDSLGYDPAQVKRDVDRALARIRREHPDKPLLLSETSFSSAQYADRRLIARRLRDAFGPSNVLITIRNQTTALPSLYLFLLQRGRIQNTGFDSWWIGGLESRRREGAPDEWMSRQFRYNDLYEVFGNVFSDGEVRIVLYEQLIEDPGTFWKDMSRFLGVDGDELLRLYLNAGRRKSGSSYSGAKFQTIYNGFREDYGTVRKNLFPNISLGKHLPFVASTLERMRSATLDALNKRKTPGNPADMSEESKRSIIEYYAEGNRKLAKACDLPLADYGYPV